MTKREKRALLTLVWIAGLTIASWPHVLNWVRLLNVIALYAAWWHLYAVAEDSPRGVQVHLNDQTTATFVRKEDR